MSLSSVQNELYNLSDESLRELNRDICDMLKRRRTSANAQAAASGRFRVGDVVSWSGRYGYNEGTITRSSASKRWSRSVPIIASGTSRSECSARWFNHDPQRSSGMGQGS